MIRILHVFFVFYFMCQIVYAADKDTKSFSILFVGDMMLDERPGELIQAKIDPFLDFSALFNKANLKIGNLECAIGTMGTSEYRKLYTFRAHPRVIPVLKKYFTALSLANNHSGDYGVAAFSKMLDLLDKQDLAYFGGGKNIREAHQAIIFHIKGKKIAILAYDAYMPRSFEALDDRAGIAWADQDNIVFDIKHAKRIDKADIVIIYPHWGVEGDTQASPRQVTLAHSMIDAGADVIVGGGPHVTQNIEMYKGRPIFYSLGNFVFNGFAGPETTTGWLLELFFTQNLKTSWKIHPVYLDKDGLPKRAISS